MIYQNRLEPGLPEWDDMFFEKQLLCHIGEECLEKVEAALKGLRPPPKQKAYNLRTGKTEQFRPEGGLYEVGEPRPPLIKCTEWIEMQAIPALISAGILKTK
ncbi:hypothetical protein GLAREA_06478 [Glarea lozoyensis ATCC 20868]|uniref:Uncharacterized protein n=1 Tax=Glarea lozoyensis (strain ATCC 20868 / MF5171) TaxID=1116229 RepID=S3D6R0_GLAL2|nr:uncharacterized protein GLAREA_06478 [Glarea lozoyensis ATCC 20868]EPE33465.1 hypothetical protein GLAREA_06478 [Glarea lozoyensis ATCC 20868]